MSQIPTFEVSYRQGSSRHISTTKVQAHDISSLFRQLDAGGIWRDREVVHVRELPMVHRDVWGRVVKEGANQKRKNSQQASDDTEGLGAIIALVALGPLLLVLLIPSVMTFQWLEANIESRELFWVAVLASAISAMVVLAMLLAVIPTSILMVLGAGLYGWMAYHVFDGSEWRLVLTVVSVLVGAGVMSVLGEKAKGRA